ncbi:ferredoxin [Streptomyces sp. LP05-1]|uniref:Ferredoxin n=1 Tax=Streptomyces pyxinae TaxID=2970734 RepID=A0ABT2CQA5_9ACTN|nr:ferredoxin [Streptomyces sp. LP05-1]MCS0639627.1 ferredoxin [Streptomyces sp. LP05-1]
MQVRVEKDRCCGSGQCVMAAPGVFDQSEDDGLVLLRPGGAEQAARADLELAAGLCPAGAITVREDHRPEGADGTATAGS